MVIPAVMRTGGKDNDVWTVTDPHDGRERAFLPKAVLKLSWPLSIRDAVRAGAGAGLVPQSIVADELAAGRLVNWGVSIEPPVEAWALHASRRLVSPKVSAGKVFNKLMLVEVGNATDLALAAFNPATSDLEKSSMAGTAINGASYAAVIPMRKTVLLDLNAAGWLAEKAEGLALVDGATLALVNDNDFGMRTQVYDAAGAAISGADVTACTSTDGVLSGCMTGNAVGVSARVARGTDAERPSRLWLINFSKNLAEFSVPASAP